jgi:hypothetical protein
MALIGTVSPALGAMPSALEAPAVMGALAGGPGGMVGLGWMITLADPWPRRG